MSKDETRKFRQLEDEHRRLKKPVADLSLDNAMLKEVALNKSFQAGKKLDENEGPRGWGLKFPGLMGLSAK